MFDLRPVFLVVGWLLVVVALAMGLPAAVDAVHQSNDWRVFLSSAAVTLFAGLMLVAANRQSRRSEMTVRQTFLFLVLGWLLVSLAAALPFIGLHLSFTDALFEAVSAVTATGATVLRGLDGLPPGILLWRSLLQWLGGFGFLVMAVVWLPHLSIGGMQLFRLETAGQTDRVMPRGAKVVMGLVGVYLALTGLLTLLLWGAGMSRFAALLHAMSTISCGGFSTSDGSVGAWRTPAIDWVILFGMVIGGSPFVIYLQLAQQRWRAVLKNTQLRWYLSILLAATIGIGAWLLLTQGVKPLPAIRHGAFTAASIMTGTGYATLDWGRWSGLPVAILFFLTFVGGCAGSTAGGIKVFRFQILLTSARMQMVRLLRPHAVLLPSYERQPVSDAVRESVMGFLFVYTLSFAALAMGLGLVGLDFLSAISAAASSLANLGPGLTAMIGPLTGFTELPDAAKWLIAAGMLFGRLEMFVMLVLFTPSFWEK